MKNLAFSLILASFSLGASANNQIDFGGVAAKEFYELLSVQETTFPQDANGGINPLRASKVFESGNVKMECNERLHSTQCKIEEKAKGETHPVVSITLKGTNADLFCESLNLHDEARNDSHSGINPLTCKKRFKSSDDALHINCNVRFFGEKSCTIYYYQLRD